MSRYSNGSIYNEGKRVDLVDAVSFSISEKSKATFSTLASLQLNTDFVGRVMCAVDHSYLSVGDGKEPSVPVQWAPVRADATSDAESINYSEPAHLVCETAVYELMAASLTLTIDGVEDESEKRLLESAAAAAKVRQLAPLTAVLNDMQASLEFAPTANRLPKDLKYVTRCEQFTQTLKPPSPLFFTPSATCPYACTTQALSSLQDERVRLLAREPRGSGRRGLGSLQKSDATGCAHFVRSIVAKPPPPHGTPRNAQKLRAMPATNLLCPAHLLNRPLVLLCYVTCDGHGVLLCLCRREQEAICSSILRSRASLAEDTTRRGRTTEKKMRTKPHGNVGQTTTSSASGCAAAWNKDGGTEVRRFTMKQRPTFK